MFELLGEGAAQRERSRRKEEDAGQELDTVLVSKAELLERIAGAEELEQKVRLHCMMHCMAQHLVHYRGAELASRRSTSTGIGQSCLRSTSLWSGGGERGAGGLCGGSESRILLYACRR